MDKVLFRRSTAGFSVHYSPSQAPLCHSDFALLSNFAFLLPVGGMHSASEFESAIRSVYDVFNGDPRTAYVAGLLRALS